MNRIAYKVDVDSERCKDEEPEPDILRIDPNNPSEIRPTSREVRQYRTIADYTMDPLDAYRMGDGKIVWPNGLCRTLASFGNLKIQSYMPTPTVMTTQSGNTAYIDANCYLSLICDTPHATRDFQSRTFRIGLKNHKAASRFFHNVYDWFIDDRWEGLFYIEKETGALVFNSEYSHTVEFLKSENVYSASILKAVPAVYKDEKYGNVREGCMLCINFNDNQVMLDDYSIEAITDLIDGFSFQEETLLLINCFMRPELWTRKLKDRM